MELVEAPNAGVLSTPVDTVSTDVASTGRVTGTWQKIFSFPVVMGALLVVLMVLTVRSRFDDPDMWWHLKTGEIIWTTHHIPSVDLFSFTAGGHPWTAHEWLSQLTIYGVYNSWGYTGLMVWLCVLAGALAVAGYALCTLYSGNVKVAFVGALGVWLFSTVGLAIRPQLIGYLFLICELLILHLGRSRDSRWFLSLPLLFAVWVNCHGSFSLGMTVLLIVSLCSLLELRTGLLVSHCWQSRDRNRLALTFALAFAALFVSPIGWKQVFYPMNTMFGQNIGLTIVSEWQPTRFDDMRGLALLGIAALVLLVPLIRHVELRLEELLLAGLGFGLALLHQRMLFVFGILVIPTLCRLLGTAWDQYERQRDRIFPNAIVLAISVLVLALAFPSSQQLAGQAQAHNPIKALEFIKRSGYSGRMLNEYIYGGYLIWAAPEHKVFVDGRSDVYEWTGVLNDYTKLITLQEDPRLLLDRYGIDFCLLSTNAPISRVVRLLPEWKSVYSDQLSTVFVRQK